MIVARTTIGPQRIARPMAVFNFSCFPDQREHQYASEDEHGNRGGFERGSVSVSFDEGLETEGSYTPGLSFRKYGTSSIAALPSIQLPLKYTTSSYLEMP